MKFWTYFRVYNVLIQSLANQMVLCCFGCCGKQKKILIQFENILTILVSVFTSYMLRRKGREKARLIPSCIEGEKGKGDFRYKRNRSIVQTIHNILTH